MSFQFFALDAAQFAPLFELGRERLKSEGARIITADEKPGYPCRVSLVDAEVGEELLALHYVHHDVHTPYRGSGPIFVRERACTAKFDPGEVPAMLLHRALSLRSYDGDGMIVEARVIHGKDTAQAVAEMLADPTAAYLHVHNAGPGCFNCRVERA